MNWRRVFLFAAVLGVFGGLLNVIGSLAGESGTEISAGLILILSSVAFVTLGCLQRHRTWLHALCISVLVYAIGDGLSRLLVPRLREPLGDSLGGLVFFVVIASAVTRAGVWLRKRMILT